MPADLNFPRVHMLKVMFTDVVAKLIIIMQKIKEKKMPLGLNRLKSNWSYL